MQCSSTSTSGKVNRVLILQGGGALGAYEVGVLQYLIEFLHEKDLKEGHPNKNIFDIVSGASIGAVNGSILVHNVVHAKSGENSYQKWKNAVEQLREFYMTISSVELGHPLWWTNICFENEWFENMWGFLGFYRKISELAVSPLVSMISDQTNTGITFEKNNQLTAFSFLQCLNLLQNTTMPSAENARRYYYYLISVIFGIPKVLSPAMIQPDFTYFDPLWQTHIYTRFSNEPLINTMKNFWDFEKYPIKTIENEPRLLIVTVDVEDSSVPVIIDSYEKDKQAKLRHSEYGDNKQYRLEYHNGITEKHVRASMSTPLRYEYPSLRVYNKDTQQLESRHFWDGAFLTNSPVLEIIRCHEEYWQNVADKKPPDLEIYMVNLFPSIKKGTPSEPYSIQDREIDMKFQNKITSEEIDEVNMKSDMEEIIHHLVSYANENDIELSSMIKEQSVKEKLNELIHKKMSSAPNILKVIKIERNETIDNSVFGKVFDFSRKTIIKLFKDGYEDSKKIMRS